MTNLSTTEIVAIGTVLVTIIGTLVGAVVNLSKTQHENKTSVVTHFKTLVDTYLSEIKRLNEELEQQERARLAEIRALKEEIATIISDKQQELAQIKAEHTEVIAKIRAEHLQEVTGLRMALQEMKEAYVKCEQDLAVIDRRKRNRHGI